jgi:SAM-dependent methyltransferase
MTQAAEWAGSVGDAWASEWRRTDRSFAALSVHLDALVQDAATPMVATAVDIGCGAGATSIALAAARPTLRLTGIDLSADLIAVARERGAALANLRFEHGPAEAVIANVSPIDLFVSRHGVMFFPDPVAAFRSLHDAAASGARLIFSCFRAAALNPWAGEIAAAIHGTSPPPPQGYVPSPFAFADPDFVHAVLTEAGWQPDGAMPLDFAYRAGAGSDPVADALSFFTSIGPAAPALRAAAPDARAAILERVAAVVERHCDGVVVDFPAAAWLWSAKA